MKRFFSILHRGLAYFLLAAVVTQFLLAGIGIFGAASLDYHRILGGLTILGSLLLALFALLGRTGRKTLGWSALLFALTLVQMMLIWFGDVSRFIPALHPLNALAVLYFAHALARGHLRAEIPAEAEKPRSLGEAAKA